MRRRDGKTLMLEGLTHDRTRHGKVRWFYRVKNRGKKQLHGITGEPPLAITPAVMEAYEDAKARLDGDRPVLQGRGTLGWLIERYMQARKFDSDLTRADYRSVFKPIQEKHGHRPYATMRAKHVEFIRDEIGGTQGNKRVKKFRVLFDWAMKQELMATNPARLADLNAVPTRGHIPWTRDDVLAFEAYHPLGSKPRLALALFLYTGARISDVRAFGPMNDRHGRIQWMQKKDQTKKIVRRDIPMVQPLRAVLDGSTLGKTTWLETEYGKPFSAKGGLGNKMRQWCDEAGLHGLSAHGIRKATGNTAAERGCTEKEIQEILGVSASVAAIYTREADKRVLSNSGFSKAFGGEG